MVKLPILEFFHMAVIKGNPIRTELKKLANPARAKLLAGFFKTGKGQYGEGDVFLGITVPETRAVARQFLRLPLDGLKPSLESAFHEERLAALLVLVEKFRNADENERKKIFDFYLKNTKHVNNWDLVDLSAHKIVGAHLLDKDKAVLYKFAESENIWERRIAVLSTFAFIGKNDFHDALKISKLLLEDKHDLIHKAVGWMLREIGKRDLAAEEKFLKKHCKKMPRTMLRYAIEKFPEKKRKFYLKRD